MSDRKEGSNAQNPAQTICQQLIENSFDVLAVMDRDGKTTFVSPSIRHVLGYKPDERIGQKAFDLVHPEDIDRTREGVSEILQKDEGRIYGQARLRHKDGSWRTTEIIAQNLISHPLIQGVLINYRDITDRLKALDSLRVLQERYYKAFDASPDAITITYITSGRILEVNAGFERITGYEREEVIGRTIPDIKLWKDSNERNRMVEMLKQNLLVRDFEAQFVDKSGHIHTCVVSAETIELGGEPCILAVTRDVTEHRLAEVELRKEREELTEKNAALKQVLEHMEEEKESFRRELSSRVENVIRPLVRKLKQSGGRLNETDVAVLENDVQRLIEQEKIVTTESALSTLTPRELDVCELIKKGLSSKEIADELGVSAQTVHKHRQVIRRKLKLDNKDVNLATYLRSL